MSELKLHPKAAESLNQWHDMISKRDLSALPGLLDPQAISAPRWLTRLTRVQPWYR